MRQRSKVVVSRSKKCIIQGCEDLQDTHETPLKESLPTVGLLEKKNKNRSSKSSLVAHISLMAIGLEETTPPQIEYSFRPQ